MTPPDLLPFSLDRMVRAVERVCDRVRRATGALDGLPDGIPRVSYAVTGGFAVAAWVATVDESAVRNTPDVDVIVPRVEFALARHLLRLGGFRDRPSPDRMAITFFDGDNAGPRDVVRITFAGESVLPGVIPAAPELTETEHVGEMRVLSLEPLVRMELGLHGLVNRVHVRDLIEVGLIDGTWCNRFVPELASRLRALLDTPGR